MTKMKYEALKEQIDKFDASSAHIYVVKSVFHDILDELYKLSNTDGENSKECPTE